MYKVLKMKKYLFALLLLPMTSVFAEEITTDNRQVVNMPSQMKSEFLKGMRGHMESLDLIIAALAENDLVEAASIAETSMGVGQGQNTQCDDEQAVKHHKHQAKGFGQFMPKEMKMMGMQLHISADEFADVAREGNMGDAYKSLRNISSTCVACHQSFQVK